MVAPTNRLFRLLSLSAFTSLVTSNSLCPAELIYQYPDEGSWLENLIFRHDGSLLLTFIDQPAGLSTLIPKPGAVPLPVVETFSGVNSTLGITETLQDVFYVLGSNCSMGDNGKAPIGAKAGTSAVFKVDFNTNEANPTVDLVTKMPEASFLNGLTKFNDTLLLATDSALGLIWGVDTETRNYYVFAEDPLMQPVPTPAGFAEGVNGANYVRQTSELYFTNSQQHLFASISLDPTTGTPLGYAKYLASSTIQDGGQPTWDDFDLDRFGNAYVASQQGNGVQVVTPQGEVKVITGNINSTQLAEPTSIKFGRTWTKRDTLYVTTAGGVAFPVIQDGEVKIVGAQLLRVDLAVCGGSLW